MATPRADGPLRLHVLGPPRLEHRDSLAGTRLRRPLALLTYLATACRPQSRDSLAALLWPDGYDARASLRRALYLLGRAIGAERLDADHSTVTIRPGSVWLDSADFRCKAEVALGPSADAVTRAERLGSLEAALDLYADDFLSGFSLPDSPAFDEWVDHERESLRQVYGAVLARHVEECHALGHWQKAISSGSRWVALDRLHEPAHRALMAVYHASGQSAAALRQYLECARTLEAELGVAPGPETALLYETIRAGRVSAGGCRARPERSSELPGHSTRASPARRTPPVAIPYAVTPFTGRERELAELRRLIEADPPSRLLTLIGLGGVGKTRLALEVASKVAASFRDGVCFVSLAESDCASSTIAAQVGLFLDEQEVPPEQMISHLRDRRLMLVLDGADERPEIVDVLLDLLTAAPKMMVMATSRERLNLFGEAVYVVESLACPRLGAPIAEEAEAEAVRFVERCARLVRPDLDLHAPRRIRAMARLARAVQGLPLALVLASSWLDVLSLDQIADEAAASLDLGESHHRDLPERQRSIRATLEHSWRRLDSGEQRVLRRLAAFRGRFTREAAAQVAGARLPTLRSLVGKSLLSSVDDGFEMHQLLRRFCLARLAESGESAAIEDALAAISGSGTGRGVRAA